MLRNSQYIYSLQQLLNIRVRGFGNNFLSRCPWQTMRYLCAQHVLPLRDFKVLQETSIYHHLIWQMEKKEVKMLSKMGLRLSPCIQWGRLPERVFRSSNITAPFQKSDTTLKKIHPDNGRYIFWISAWCTAVL